MPDLDQIASTAPVQTFPGSPAYRADGHVDKSRSLPTVTDVLVVGGGPIGLLCAYQLGKFSRGKTRVVVIDKEHKPSLPVYGRACTLWPRTMEMWDQLGLMDDVLDEGVASKTGFNFKDGKAIPGGLSFGHRMDKLGDTAYNFAFHLRQRLIELIFERKAKESTGQDVYFCYELEDFTDSTASAHHGNRLGLEEEVNINGMIADAVVKEGDDKEEEYPITASVRHMSTGELMHIKAKYIIGADGGRSRVRKISGIPFIGTRSGSKWIRMDAVVDTDMPSPRCLNSVQSENHGLMLWCPIDNGRTRIGYVFSEELQKKWGVGEDGVGVTEEAVIAEAKEALRPFNVTFKKVDWFTIYGIGQCIAQDFVKGRVILAGDACHTHSSGSAQGLNTGSHDAINVAWKLSLILRKLAPRQLIATYAEERKASVQQVIDNDTVIATLISGNYPDKYKGRQESTRQLLNEWFESAANQSFTLGLGVAYGQENMINRSTSNAWPLSTIPSGQRGPDARLSRIGTGEQRRLLGVLANDGKFNLVVFAGMPHLTRSSTATLRASLDSKASFLRQSPRAHEVVAFTTLIVGDSIGAAEALDCAPFGRAFFDTYREAHDAYGVDVGKGAMIVLRPDGHLATVFELATAAVELGRYFASFTTLGAL